jgi:hypothetical protein
MDSETRAGRDRVVNVYWIVIPGVLILIVGFLAYELTKPKGQQQEEAASDVPEEASQEANSKL